MPIRLGRGFTWNDWGSTREYAVVNEALADQYLPNQVPIGRQMARGRDQAPDIEIIGVLANARSDAVRGECRARRSSRWAACGWRP